MFKFSVKASHAVPYFLIGFFSVFSGVLLVDSVVAEEPRMFQEERAAALLMECVRIGGDRHYDSQMRFSHCVVRAQ
ncbi:MAG: hypothetical protein AB7O43_02340 [Hyphomicrobiaceae bacterium]